MKAVTTSALSIVHVFSVGIPLSIPFSIIYIYILVGSVIIGYKEIYSSWKQRYILNQQQSTGNQSEE